MDEFININKLSSKFRSQCNLLCELKTNVTELRPDLLKGFFFNSNQDAFAIAEDVVSGDLTELRGAWVDSVGLAIEDIVVITSCERKNISTLSDIGVTIREILDDIERYDQYSNFNS